MKTTIDIPDQLLKDVMQDMGVATKREAVVGALQAQLRRKQLEKARKMLGTFTDSMTAGDVRKSRESRAKRNGLA